MVRAEVVENWNVDDWNSHLASEVFGGNGEPVTFVEAHPVGLAETLGWPTLGDDPGRAVGLLVDAHRELVVSCSGSVVSAAMRRCRDKIWHRRPETVPPYVSLLWLTCLVAWGHPDGGEGNFATRWAAAFGTDGGGVQPVHGEADIRTARLALDVDRRMVEVRDLWEHLASWLAGSSTHRGLVLPEPARFERHVGTSYGLCQPDLRDRRWLASRLAEAELTGTDPPPGPTLRLLTSSLSGASVSELFAAQLSRLNSQGFQPAQLRRDPVWAAVRRECLDPVASRDKIVPLSAFSAVVEVMDGEVYGDLVLRSDIGVETPPGTRWHVDPYRPSERVLDGPSRQGGLWPFLDDPWARPQTGLARLVREGLICLGPASSGRLEVLTGAEIARATDVVVRDDLLTAVEGMIGGRRARVPCDGWLRLRDVSIRSVDEGELPTALAGVRQLVRTSTPPTARWVGGVRVASGLFYPERSLLPDVLAPGASSVAEVPSGRELLIDDGGRWRLEPGVSRGRLSVRVFWPPEDGWEPIKLTAGFSASAIAPPQDFDADDHEFVAAENRITVDADPGLQSVGKRLPNTTTSHPMRRHAGSYVGAVDVREDEAVLTHYGRLGDPKLTFVHDRPLHEERSSHDGLRRRWRRDVAAVAGPTNRALRGDQLLARDDDQLRRLRAASSPNGRREADEPSFRVDDALVLIDQLVRAHEDPRVTRMAPQLLGVLCVAASRRALGVRNFVEFVAELTDPTDRMTTGLIHELLRTTLEAGRAELAHHLASRGTRLVGVRPRIRVAFVHKAPASSIVVFDGALVGLVDSLTADAIKHDLSRVADVRWLASSTIPAKPSRLDRMVAPVLKFLTDDINEVRRIVKSHLGGKLAGDIGKLPTTPTVVPFVVQPSAVRPVGFSVENSYVFDAEGPMHHHGRVDADGVVVERCVHLDFHDRYVVRHDNDVVGIWPDREWAAMRAAEVAGVPLFGRCRHGMVASRSALFPRLPLPIARGLLTHGLALASAVCDDDRVQRVIYPFGRGASALDELPGAWFSDDEDCSCSTH